MTIGEGAFAGCSGLISLDFSGATGLETIGEAAFANSKITTLDLSGATKLETIGNYAFSGCTGLTGTLTIPSSVLTIGRYAFAGCRVELIVSEDLYDVRENWNQDFKGTIRDPYIFTYSNNKTEITGLKDANYAGAAVIPSHVVRINGSAFLNSKITSLDLSGATSLTTISESAFQGCDKLTSLTIGGNIETIGLRAFKVCSKLEILDLSGATRLTEIGISAFESCTGLTGVTIPSSVTTIGNYAFSFCDKFEYLDLSVATKLTNIDENAFAECGLKSLDLISGTTRLASVDNFAFRECIGLAGKTVNSRSSTVIADNAFAQIDPAVTIQRI